MTHIHFEYEMNHLVHKIFYCRKPLMAQGIIHIAEQSESEDGLCCDRVFILMP